MIDVDTRALLIRSDLAEAALEGIVPTRAYRPTEAMQATVPVADVSDDNGNRISQLLFGEAFDVLIRQGGRRWGRCRRDGVVGWVADDTLRPGVRMPTDRVASPGGVLPFNALVDPARDAVGDVALMPLGAFEPDLVAVAETFLGVPYAAGGRTESGTDCSGLVQACLIAGGRPAPRNADAQAELGEAVGRTDLRRGNIVVWPYTRGDRGWTGHSAIALGPDAVIHAVGTEGRVLVQALDEADTNQRAEGFDAPIFRRL